jgi:hypothetical protein
MSDGSMKSLLVGKWCTKMMGEEREMNVVYEFVEDGVFALAAGDTPPSAGTWTLAEQVPQGETKLAILSLEMPVFVMPLKLDALVKFKGEDSSTVVLRYVDDVNSCGEQSFLDTEKSTHEQLTLTRWSLASEEGGSALASLSAEIAALSHEERKIQCVTEFLRDSLSAGMNAFQKEDGLGGALVNMMGAAMAGEGGDGAPSDAAMSSVAASNYLHKAIVLGAEQSCVFGKYGFTNDEIQQFLAEPEMQQLSQQIMMQTMMGMFGNMALAGGEGGAPPGGPAGDANPFAALMGGGDGAPPDLSAMFGGGAPGMPPSFAGIGEGEQVDEETAAAGGFEAGMQAAMAMFGGQQPGAEQQAGQAPPDLAALLGGLGGAPSGTTTEDLLASMATGGSYGSRVEGLDSDEDDVQGNGNQGGAADDKPPDCAQQ